MRKELRLKPAQLFKKVYKEGKSIAAREAVLCFLYLGPGLPTRAGFSISKKVGNAVTRNRIKRRLKSVVETAGQGLRSGYVLVIIGRPPAAHSSFAELRNSVRLLLRRAQILEGDQ